MPQQADAALRERVLRHYRWCAEAIRDGDVDGFLDWLGPDGTFMAADGTTVRVADTRPFWEWRFANVIAVRRVEIEVESVAWNDDGLVVVDFHELSDLTVRGFDGKPVERDADLHNRNLWEISEDRPTTRGGEEVNVRRSLNGRPLSDETTPWVSPPGRGTSRSGQADACTRRWQRRSAIAPGHTPRMPLSDRSTRPCQYGTA